MGKTGQGRRKLLSLMWGDIKYLTGSFFPQEILGPTLIRPPGAVDEVSFLSICQRCMQCAQICPEKAIKIAGPQQGPSLGTPYLEPGNRPCTFCRQCIEACPSGALSLKEETKLIIGKAKINTENCLAWQGQVCGTCQNICPTNAIRRNQSLHPIIAEKECIGCGLCAGICLSPKRAIEINPLY